MNIRDIAFGITVGHEGDTLDLTPGDRGNWTGGKVGEGLLRGSKFGISAASYPTLDIASLTRAQGEALYVSDFWQPMFCDSLPSALAILLFDSAVNNGRGGATELLQAAVGARVDGDFGPLTHAAVDAALAQRGVLAVCGEFHGRRIAMMSRLEEWPEFADGWSARLAHLPMQAAAYLPT